MNLQMIFISLVLLLMNLSFVQCQSSKLPKAMPDGVKIDYFEGGGMLRAYTKITIEENTLTVEELKGGEPNAKQWTAEITPAEKENLYRIFVENKFDLIKNDKREGIVHDAGSESISLSFGRQFYRATYGANSPMSGASQKRYTAVSKAVQDFAAQYKSKSAENAGNFVVIPFNNRNHSWIFKTEVAAATLNKNEIAAVENLLTKAVDDHNANVRDNRRRINLAVQKRQFVPVLNNKGEKEVWVNSFCRDYENWQTELVRFIDWAQCAFSVYVNLDANNYYNFSQRLDATR